MKLLLCFLSVAVLAVCGEELRFRDLSHVRPIADKFANSKISAALKALLPVQPDRGSRITNGQEAVPHSLPYQVATFVNTPLGTFFCGGSIISVDLVLTAAHCVDM